VVILAVTGGSLTRRPKRSLRCLSPGRGILTNKWVPKFKSSSLAQVIAKISYQLIFWRRNLSHNSLFCQIPSVSSKELALPRLVRCELSRLRCHGHSLSLVVLPMQDKTEGEFYLQRLRTPFAGSNSLPSGFFRIWASPARHLWHYTSSIWPLVQTLGRGPTVGSSWSSSTLPSLGRVRVSPPPPYKIGLKLNDRADHAI